MSFEHAGIDIGTNHVRHVSFVKKGEYMHIKHFGMYDIPTLTKDAVLLEQTEILLALKKIQKEFRYKYVEVSLPEDLVYIYTMEVDGVDEENVRGQVEFRIEENVPLKIDEAVFDITPVLYLKATNKSLVSVAVVSKKVIEDYITLFRQASLEIVSFLVQNQALSKTLISKDDHNPYCIVAVEKRNIVVSIVSAGIVLYTSTLTQSVFKDDLTLEQKEVFQDLVKDIYKVIVFWLSYIEKNARYGFKPLKAILLSSTHREILESDFAHILHNELALDVHNADVWVNVPIPKNTVPEIYKKDSYQYATAIGLAMPKI
jgi:Tfp pilus assembly PilM family ATPase